jgi:hypothetical protein
MALTEHDLAAITRMFTADAMIVANAASRA